MTTHSFSLFFHIQAQSYPIHHLQAYETFSHNFYARLIFYFEENQNEIKSWLGQNAYIEITCGEEKKIFNGFVIAINYSRFPGRNGLYQAKIKLSSWPILFRNNREFRIFENKDVLEILQQLFNPYRECKIDFSYLKHTYSKLPYKVQYQESTLQFMNRLLVEAKIESYFIHNLQDHCLVLRDNRLLTQPCQENCTFSHWQSRYSRCLPERHYAQSTNLSLQLNESYLKDNQRYRIIALYHEATSQGHGSQSYDLSENSLSYWNRCTFSKEKEAYRKTRPFFKPSILGVQNAEIHQLKDEGIKLSYPWTNMPTQYPAPYLELLADAEQRLQLGPEVGTEVLVGFLRGDPEQPIVLGSNYNQLHPLPFDPETAPWQSGFKAASVLNDSEISFNDQQSHEMLLIKTAGNYYQSTSTELKTVVQGAYKQQIAASLQFQSGEWELQAKQLLLRAGQSSIQVGPEEIQINSPLIELN